MKRQLTAVLDFEYHALDIAHDAEGMPVLESFFVEDIETVGASDCSTKTEFEQILDEIGIKDFSVCYISQWRNTITFFDAEGQSRKVVLKSPPGSYDKSFLFRKGVIYSSKTQPDKRHIQKWLMGFAKRYNEMHPYAPVAHYSWEMFKKIEQCPELMYVHYKTYEPDPEKDYPITVWSEHGPKRFVVTRNFAYSVYGYEVDGVFGVDLMSVYDGLMAKKKSENVR